MITKLACRIANISTKNPSIFNDFIWWVRTHASWFKMEFDGEWNVWVSKAYAEQKTRDKLSTDIRRLK